jgi:hypothetical protein
MMREGTEIDRAVRRAVHQALETHRRLGHSVAMTINGKPAIVPASKLRLPKA